MHMLGQCNISMEDKRKWGPEIENFNEIVPSSFCEINRENLRAPHFRGLSLFFSIFSINFEKKMSRVDSLVIVPYL